MSHGFPRSRGVKSVSKLVDVFRIIDWPLNQFDPDGLRYVATVSVRVHWFLSVVVLVETVYRTHSVRRLSVAQHRVDSGRGQDRTLRGMTPIECATDGWS